MGDTMIRFTLLPWTITLWLFTFYVNSTHAAGIRIANGEWEPFLSEKLPFYGHTSHIVTKSFEASGVSVHYEFMPWGRAEKLVESGGIDASIIWVPTEDRKVFARFTETVLILEEVIFFNKPLHSNLEFPLNNLKMGAPMGSEVSSYESLIEAGKLELVRAKDIKTGFMMLINGRIDIFPLSKPIGLNMLHSQFSQKQRELVGYQSALKPIVNKYSVMISRKSSNAEHWVRAFNHGYKKLQDAGTIQEIEQAFYRGEYEPKDRVPE